MDNLHEQNISLWMGTTTEPGYPSLAQDIEVDVAVIGAGITGLSVAAMLKRAGKRVAVIESGHVGAGTTGYTTAKVTSLHGVMYAELVEDVGHAQAQLYADANEAAITEVARMVEEFGIDCDFQRADAVSYTTDAGQLDRIHAEVEAAQSLGLPASFTHSTELPFPVAGAVRFTKQAMFHPRKYCLGLAAAIDSDGSPVFEHTTATDVTCDETCEVQTDRGTVRARHVVMATHIPFLDRGGFFTRAHPARSYAMALQINGAVPEHMYLGIDSPTRSVRSHREGGATYLIVGGEGHKVGQDDDTRERYEALEHWAREHYDVTSVAYKWSAQDYMPVDDVPYIGRITSKNNRILVATGFKKWGMTTGTVAGMILSDMIAGRDNPWSSVFDSTRADVRRSAKQFVTENLNVAKHLVGDRVKALKPASVADLAVGEGGIVEANGEKVAAYRDQSGTLHAVSPACTHLGCFVTWNTAERSWDCPCHGSRFTIAGEVLHGPAVKPLEMKSISTNPAASSDPE